MAQLFRRIYARLTVTHFCAGETTSRTDTYSLPSPSCYYYMTELSLSVALTVALFESGVLN